jgi:hypothetical protein
MTSLLIGELFAWRTPMQLNYIIFFLAFASLLLFLWFHFKGLIGKQRRTNEIWREFAQQRGLQERPVGSSSLDVSFDEEFDEVRDRPVFDDYEAFISFHSMNRDRPFVLECIATEGKPMRVGKLNLRSGEGIRIFTRIKIGLGDLPRGFQVYRETAWSKLGKAVGLQDIATGDASFDKLFVVKGNDQLEVLDYLTPSRRMALQGCVERYPDLNLREGELVIMQPGQTDSTEQLDRYIVDINVSLWDIKSLAL